MRKIAFIFLICLFAIGCEPESSDLETRQFNLPTWLKGEYIGIHTNQNLSISDQNIVFKVGEQQYNINSSMIVSESEDASHYRIDLESDVLIFNKTTLNEEINFQFNNLYLGWYKNILSE